MSSYSLAFKMMLHLSMYFFVHRNRLGVYMPQQSGHEERESHRLNLGFLICRRETVHIILHSTSTILLWSLHFSLASNSKTQLEFYTQTPTLIKPRLFLDMTSMKKIGLVLFVCLKSMAGKLQAFIQLRNDTQL